jgi:hypothetical protein
MRERFVYKNEKEKNFCSSPWSDETLLIDTYNKTVHTCIEQGEKYEY